MSASRGRGWRCSRFSRLDPASARWAYIVAFVVLVAVGPALLLADQSRRAPPRPA